MKQNVDKLVSTWKNANDLTLEADVRHGDGSRESARRVVASSIFFASVEVGFGGDMGLTLWLKVHARKLGYSEFTSFMGA